MLGKVVLAFLIVPVFGYLAEAALFSAYFVISVGILTLKGLAKIRHQSSLANKSVS
jgi:hypothetical protein